MTAHSRDKSLSSEEDLPTRERESDHCWSVTEGCVVSKIIEGKWGPYLYHVTKHQNKQTWKYLGKRGSARANEALQALGLLGPDEDLSSTP